MFATELHPNGHVNYPYTRKNYVDVTCSRCLEQFHVCMKVDYGRLLLNYCHILLMKVYPVIYVVKLSICYFSLFLITFIYFFILHANHSFSSLLSSLPHLLFFSYSKKGTVRWINFQKSTIALGTDLSPTAKNPPLVQATQLLHICRGPTVSHMQVPWLLIQTISSYELKLFDSEGFLVLSLSLWLLRSFLTLFSRIPQARPNVWPLVSVLIFISHWLNPLWWLLGLAPIYQYRRILLGIIILTFFFTRSLLGLWASSPLVLVLQAVRGSCLWHRSRVFSSGQWKCNVCWRVCAL